MDIPNIPDWCRANAGRKIKWRGSLSKVEKIGRIVGYSKKSNKLVVDGHAGATSYPSGTEWLVPDLDHTAFAYAWLEPSCVIEFIDPPTTLIVNKKSISDYPHECPRCHGPAYIGFLTTIDCQKKCNSE